MESKRNASSGSGRGIVSGAGIMFALLSASGANAQTSGGSPNPFVNINALEGVSSYEVQADGTLKVVLADGRTLMLPADAFVSTEAGLFLDLPVLTEAMTASAAAAGIAGSPLLLLSLIHI